MLKINELKRLDLGIKGENESKTLQIDMSAWASLYPNATAEILHKRSGDNTKTLTGATYDGDTMILTWIPTETDTFYEGFGVAEIRMVEGNVVKKTKDLIVTAVCPSVIDGSGTIIESTWQAFLNSVINTKQGAVDAKNAAVTAQGLAEDAADDAEASADDAEAAAAAAEAATVHEPTIDDVSGNWLVWDQDTGEYVDTGVHAQGPQGEPGTIENVRATGIKMSIMDDTTVYDAINAKPDTSDIPTKVSELDNDEGYITDDDITGKADKVSSATSGNFAGLDANGNLTDSGHKHSDYLTQHQDISGKADKVTSATNGNFAALDANGNLTDSGHKHSDYITDVSDKVDKNQGAGNAGKALGIGNDGMVTPVPFSGEDFTGATSSTAGVHGYVPAPAAGDQEKVLTGDGTWQTVPGAKLITVDLTTITNVSGSYTGTTSDDRVTSDMKPVMLNLGTPGVIRDNPTVTCNNGSVTFTCSDVVGTTTAQVSMIKVIVDPTEVTSTEFDILNNRIGTLSSLTTTAKSSAVAAINELDSDISSIEQIVFGSNTKDLITNLQDYWTTYIPNDEVPHLVCITVQYGAYIGYLQRYSTSYGSGVLTKYNGDTVNVTLDNGTVYVNDIPKIKYHEGLYDETTTILTPTSYAGHDTGLYANNKGLTYYIDNVLKWTNIPAKYACSVLVGNGLTNYGWDGCNAIKIGNIVVLTVALTTVPQTAALTPLVEIPSAIRPTSRRAIGAGTKGSNGDESCTLMITTDLTSIMANTAVNGFVTGTIVYTI